MSPFLVLTVLLLYLKIWVLMLYFLVGKVKKRQSPTLSLLILPGCLDVLRKRVLGWVFFGGWRQGTLRISVILIKIL